MPVGGYRPGMFTLYHAYTMALISNALNSVMVYMSSSHSSQLEWAMSILKQ